jgi:hypothetical protein
MVREKGKDKEIGCSPYSASRLITVRGGMSGATTIVTFRPFSILAFIDIEGMIFELGLALLLLGLAVTVLLHK